MDNQKTILICPLDWGLGHAARCIPIIRYYQNLQYEVVIAGYGKSLDLLKNELTDVRFDDLPGIEIQYSSSTSQLLKIFFQVPSLLWWKHKEHRLVKKLIDRYHPHILISDNRYGLWSKGIQSILITHQLKLTMPQGMKWIEPFTGWVLKRWIERFDECWVPDNEGKLSLAGEMVSVKKPPRNVRFIGLLSRFYPVLPEWEREVADIDIVAIVSGPEPHRTMLIHQLTRTLSTLSCHSVLLTGNPAHTEDVTINQLRIVGHLSTRQLAVLIRSARTVICRSGYSGIMDLIAFEKKALLIPTPGQTEQEYLAKRLSDRGWFTLLHSTQLEDLEKWIDNKPTASFPPFQFFQDLEKIVSPNNFKL